LCLTISCQNRVSLSPHVAMACRSVLNHPLVIPLTPVPDEDNLRKPWKRNGQHINQGLWEKSHTILNYLRHCHCRIQWWIQQLSKRCEIKSLAEFEFSFNKIKFSWDSWLCYVNQIIKTQITWLLLLLSSFIDPLHHFDQDTDQAVTSDLWRAQGRTRTRREQWNVAKI
jgi:hypothetical protein